MKVTALGSDMFNGN